MKLLNKKGVELTMSAVVIAVLVIIVLIVLIVIFTQGAGGFWGTISSCEDRGGHCAGDAESCLNSGGKVYRIGKCTDGVCCVPQENLLGNNENEFN